MEGYFASFLITHLINFALSLRRLLRITGVKIPLSIPFRTLSALAGALGLSSLVSSPGGKILIFLPALASGLVLLGLTGKEDLRWFRNLLLRK